MSDFDKEDWYWSHDDVPTLSGYWDRIEETVWVESPEYRAAPRVNASQAANTKETAQ